MLRVKLLCVGKLKEKFFQAAAAEYEKRLGAYCRIEVQEIPEQRLGENPSHREIEAALAREAAELRRHISGDSYVIALCVEGQMYTSPELAGLLKRCADTGRSRICLIIGGSYGLAEEIKSSAQVRLSLSKMTLPHHLARVVLVEQIYRACTLNAGVRYHK